jgi:hypothetical protein
MNKNFELTLSFIVVGFLAIVYIGYESVTIPKGGHSFGHALGILGSVLMIMAETVYSARKRWRFFRAGQMRHWLSFHIFTGIVGPALVLMHTGFAFRGLAGLTMLMTVLVVVSGFLGRYIYTAVPRTMAGVEVDRRTLEAELRQQQETLQGWAFAQPEPIQLFIQNELSIATAVSDLSSGAVLIRPWQDWQEQSQLRSMIRSLEKTERTKLAQFEKLIRQQRRLSRQIRSLQTVRRLMGLWHTAHVPLGLTLFGSMTIHIIATIYFGALQ